MTEPNAADAVLTRLAELVAKDFARFTAPGAELPDGVYVHRFQPGEEPLFDSTAEARAERDWQENRNGGAA